MVHSHRTVLNAGADKVSRFAATQDLLKAECTVLRAGMSEDALRKQAELSDLILRQVSGRYDAGPRDHGYVEQESGRRPVQAEGLRQIPRPEHEFDGFLEAAPDAVVIADQDGRIIRVNAQTEKLFGYLRGELLGREVEILMPERFRGQHIGQRTDYFANPVTRPMGTGQQLYGLRKDGHEFPTEISLSPLPAEDGFVIASAIRDVTENRRMEEELRKRTQELEDAVRHKDEFLGILAHELRNPLAAISNAIEVLRLSPPNADPEWVCDVISRQTEQVVHLVEDLMDVSRLAHGKVSLRKVPVELSQLINQAIEAVRPLLNTRTQQLAVSLPSQSVRLLADPTRLVQVLTNLLNNAAKYTEDDGHIWLTATEEEGEVVVRVRDNGIGIAAVMLPRVFDLFTQVPGALDRSDGGIGIGLAMVDQLIKLHGGSVKAFSDGPGRGSEFVVRLPLLSATCAERNGT
jgi:PAS domain S-box-containing protein